MWLWPNQERTSTAPSQHSHLYSHESRLHFSLCRWNSLLLSQAKRPICLGPLCSHLLKNVASANEFSHEFIGSLHELTQMARYPSPSQHASKQNRRPWAHVPNRMSISMLSSKDVKSARKWKLRQSLRTSLSGRVKSQARMWGVNKWSKEGETDIRLYIMTQLNET